MKKTILLSCFCFIGMFLMLLHPDYVTKGASTGLLMWYQSVVPALFPFMVISALISSMGGIEILMSPIHRLLHHVIPISKNGCYVLLSGLLCGYPMGAKTCADLVNSDQITLQEGKFLLSICNHPSPMFLLGYVYPFLKKSIPLPAFLFSIYGPVVILAILAKYVYRINKQTSDTSIHTTKIPDHTDSVSQNISLDDQIMTAAYILCKICGYLILFSVVIVFLKNAKWLPDPLKLLFIISMEITTGVREISTSLSLKHTWIMMAAALGFGGFSGIFQTRSVLKNEKKAGLSIRPYILWKLLHAVLSAGIAAILCNIVQY